MASPDNKHVATVIALGMPPPHMLGKDGGDEPEGSDEDKAEKSAAASGGEKALADMFAKLKAGDIAGAYDDFMDAAKQCMAALKMKDAEGDSSDDGSKGDNADKTDEGGDY